MKISYDDHPELLGPKNSVSHHIKTQEIFIGEFFCCLFVQFFAHSSSRVCPIMEGGVSKTFEYIYLSPHNNGQSKKWIYKMSTFYQSKNERSNRLLLGQLCKTYLLTPPKTMWSIFHFFSCNRSFENTLYPFKKVLFWRLVVKLRQKTSYIKTNRF